MSGFTGVLVYEKGVLVLVDPVQLDDDTRVTEDGELRLTESGEVRKTA